MTETVDVREAAAILSRAGFELQKLWKHADLYHFNDIDGNYVVLAKRNGTVFLRFDIPRSGGAVETVDFLTGLVRLVDPVTALSLLAQDEDR